MRTRSIALVVVALLAIGAGGALAKGKKKGKRSDVHPSVTYAKTWEAAVEEAKLLNVPIVVHSHGFY